MRRNTKLPQRDNIPKLKVCTTCLDEYYPLDYKCCPLCKGPLKEVDIFGRSVR